MSITVTDVEPGVRRVHASSWRGRLVGYDVSAYLIGDVLVDTGFPRVRAGMLQTIQSLRPRGVIVTHWHEDHAGNAPAIASAGIPVLMHAFTERTLRHRPAIRAYRRLVWGQSPRLGIVPAMFDPAPLRVIDTPGHTEDHRIVWDAERRIVASGDLFLGVKVRVAHPHESPTALVNSLRVVAALEPRLLLDAHRGPVSNAAALVRVKIAWMEETIGAIRARALAGDEAGEIRRRVLGGEPMVGRLSRGDYSKSAFVHAVLAE